MKTNNFNEHYFKKALHYFIKGFLFAFLPVLIFGYFPKNTFAQESPSVLFVPLIGITSVPEPSALPVGAGNVTYKYAVKNFLSEVALTDIQVFDDNCSPINFTEGDDNGDSKLDYQETWRYTCTTRLSVTTQSTATATGSVYGITATHKAYATVVVGSSKPAPLVSIVNITKVAYPLSLPVEGGNITFTYKVNNPGEVALNNVTVTDDKCSAMSGKLGDTNGNNLLDVNEVWVYTCTTNLKRTTTNRAIVTAYANGLKAIGDTTITVKVDTPNFPDAGKKDISFNFKNTVWGVLLGILGTLIVFFFLTRKGKLRRNKKKRI